MLRQRRALLNPEAYIDTKPENLILAQADNPMNDSPDLDFQNLSSEGPVTAAETLYDLIETDHAGTEHLIRRLLESIRTYTNMDIGFISRFEGGRRHFLYISSDSPDPGIEEGDSDPQEESLCMRIAVGDAPNFIPDAREHESVNDLEVVDRLNIRTYAGIPIFIGDGAIYGTLCCYSRDREQPLDEKDIAFMSVVVDIISAAVEDDIKKRQHRDERREYFNDIMESGALEMVWQPIFETQDHRLVAFESLARFRTTPYRPPNEWFDEAVQLGVGATLERNAFAKGADILEQLPEGCSVACNVSGKTVLDESFQEFLRRQRLDHLTIEITEHDIVTDYEELVHVLDEFRGRGLRLAIDDFGAGYSSFRHTLRLNPDIIKLDMSLVRNIDIAHKTQAVVRAMAAFASESEAILVAEGVETRGELEALTELGVNRVQGYLMHKPMSAPEAIKLAAAEYG